MPAAPVILNNTPLVAFWVLGRGRLNGIVVMDERKGRRYAGDLDWPLTGSLGLLLLAKERGLLKSVRCCSWPTDRRPVLAFGRRSGRQGPADGELVADPESGR